jgi:hypothetical protein
MFNNVGIISTWEITPFYKLMYNFNYLRKRQIHMPLLNIVDVNIKVVLRLAELYFAVHFL